MTVQPDPTLTVARALKVQVGDETAANKNLRSAAKSLVLGGAGTLIGRTPIALAFPDTLAYLDLVGGNLVIQSAIEDAVPTVKTVTLPAALLAANSFDPGLLQAGEHTIFWKDQKTIRIAWTKANQMTTGLDSIDPPGGRRSHARRGGRVSRPSCGKGLTPPGLL
ncbi:MAG: hypothetical protein WCG80_04625 [Spirochaetales bacterium]